MESFAILIDFIIKWGLFSISALLLFRLYYIRKDKKRHYFTKTLTIIALSITLFIFIGEFINKRKAINRYAGVYKLKMYKCNDCVNCFVELTPNNKYIVTSNGLKIDSGRWDVEFGTFDYYVKIENGEQQFVPDSSKTICYIKNENCQQIWRNRNLKTEINGEIISVDSLNPIYGVYSFKIKSISNSAIIEYKPHYIGHPWLNKYLKVGNFIQKKKNSMEFTIKDKKAGLVKIGEQ